MKFLSYLLAGLFCVPLLTANVSVADDEITFSEFPLWTYISDQYADKGVIFSGDSPFICTDGANPTSPVLSGSPRFQGRIEGSFVDPEDGESSISVQSFELDAGYFDAIGSTKIEWFDKDGNKLGQRANTRYGIQNFKIEGGNIASWKIGIFEDEPAGYAIDNFKINLIGPSIVFREKKENDGFWWLLGDEIPGFDHAGFHTNNLVYESHPGYSNATYVSNDGSESVTTTAVFGVQAQHTLKTFKHYSSDTDNTKVTDVEEIPIDEDLAASMKTLIEGKLGAGFRLLDFSSPEGITETMSPFAQKGGDDNKFTCIGLIEWAAEQAGHNGGQGFIRNIFESITYPTFSDDIPPKITMQTLPLLSPQLLHYNMKFSGITSEIIEFFQGLFDPVDFIITDPIGRRLGYVASIGEINEIPGAFFSGDGLYEQFFIPNPLPGDYIIQLFGKGDKVLGAFGSATYSQGIEEDYVADDETLTRITSIESTIGSPGDVNEDGQLDDADIAILKSLPKQFVNDFNNPADVNRDGVISDEDVVYLEHLISPLAGDLNIDGCIDRADFSIIIGDIKGPEPHNPVYDLNGDGYVNISDARYLVRLFTNPRGASCQ